jgi:hypothetical protein
MLFNVILRFDGTANVPYPPWAELEGVEGVEGIAEPTERTFSAILDKTELAMLLHQYRLLRLEKKLTQWSIKLSCAFPDLKIEAFVTPFFADKDGRRLTDRNWRRVRRAFERFVTSIAVEFIQEQLISKAQA